MAYITKDGKRFARSQSGRRYDEWLKSMLERGRQDMKDAPREGHDYVTEKYGPAFRVVIEREGIGRTRVTSHHRGRAEPFTQVYPETFRAHDAAGCLLAIDPPPAVQTHSRARSQPIGPKEDERIRVEDGREDNEE